MGLTQIHSVVVYSTAVILVAGMSFVLGDDVILQKGTEKVTTGKVDVTESSSKMVPICNSLGGCAVPQSQPPPNVPSPNRSPHGLRPRKHTKPLAVRQNAVLKAMFRINTEPAVEQLNKQILSEVKTAEAMQQARAAMTEQQQAQGSERDSLDKIRFDVPKKRSQYGSICDLVTCGNRKPKYRSEESMETLFRMNTEPAVEELNKQILSQVKMAEAIQEAREALNEQQEQRSEEDRLNMEEVMEDRLQKRPFCNAWGGCLSARFAKSTSDNDMSRHFLSPARMSKRMQEEQVVFEEQQQQQQEQGPENDALGFQFLDEPRKRPFCNAWGGCRLARSVDSTADKELNKKIDSQGKTSSESIREARAVIGGQRQQTWEVQQHSRR